MENLIDLHAHILPGIDDGAQTIDEALKIARAARKAGFCAIAATPHRLEGVYDVSEETVIDAFEKLQNAIKKEGVDITLYRGAEYYLDDRFLPLLEQGKMVGLGGSKTLLCELPMMRIPPYFADFAFRMRLKGYTPLLAHPERYNDIVRKPKRARELVEKGFLLQVNLGSFSGLYGRTVRKTARFLIEDGLVTVAASDVHAPKYTEKIYDQGMNDLVKFVGEQAFKELSILGPQRLLNPAQGDV